MTDLTLRDLEANAHLPEVQELLQQEIRRGTIRVIPKRGGGIRIVPVGEPETDEPTEAEPLPAPSKVAARPTRGVARRGRLPRR
jgi:hypothetical protein